MMREKPIARQTLQTQVAEVIRHRIMTGELKPGQRINEAELSNEFSVSRGPVREALRQLEGNLVEYLPYKGCVVRNLSYEDMQESYLLRSTLECLAVESYEAKLPEEYKEELETLIMEMKEASETKDMYRITVADEKFHSRIAEASGSKKLLKLWKSMEGDNVAAYMTMNNEGLTSYDVIGENHQYLLDGILSGNVEEATKRIKEHYMVVPQVLNKKRQG